MGRNRVRDGLLLRTVLAAKATLAPWLVYDLVQARRAWNSWQAPAPGPEAQREGVTFQTFQVTDCIALSGGFLSTLLDWLGSIISGFLCGAGDLAVTSPRLHQRHAPLSQATATSAARTLQRKQCLVPRS